jgi:hypothetical protein
MACPPPWKGSNGRAVHCGETFGETISLKSAAEERMGGFGWSAFDLKPGMFEFDGKCGFHDQASLPIRASNPSLKMFQAALRSFYNSGI